MSNSNNGLITKIWGPGLWLGMHSISFGYPLYPSIEQKNNYKNFFTLMGDVLPCKYCRESYKHFISTEPTILNDSVMENRETLTRWLYNIHERVNQKLGVDYKVSYEDIVNKYEVYRAKCTNNIAATTGCTMPLGDKKTSYFVASIKESPIIDIELANKCVNYAKERNLDPKEFNFLNFYKANPNIKPHDTKCDMWCKRNKECTLIKENMRINGIPSIEEHGKYKGLPTIDELKLLLRLTSTLEKEDQETLKRKMAQSPSLQIPYYIQPQRRYKLTKKSPGN